MSQDTKMMNELDKLFFAIEHELCPCCGCRLAVNFTSRLGVIEGCEFKCGGCYFETGFITPVPAPRSLKSYVPEY